MKKGLIAALIAVACAALVIPTIAFAAVSTSSLSGATAMRCASDAVQRANMGKIVGDGVYAGWHHNYVDENGDGICDNYVDGVCNGTCEGYGHPGCGGNFVDADGDGVCDNLNTGNTLNDRRGYGGNYVDSDGDGVCDNYDAHHRSGAGSGNRSGAGAGSGSGAAAGSGAATGNGSGFGHHGPHHR